MKARLETARPSSRAILTPLSRLLRASRKKTVVGHETIKHRGPVLGSRWLRAAVLRHCTPRGRRSTRIRLRRRRLPAAGAAARQRRSRPRASKRARVCAACPHTRHGRAQPPRPRSSGAPRNRSQMVQQQREERTTRTRTHEGVSQEEGREVYQRLHDCRLQRHLCGERRGTALRRDASRRGREEVEPAVVDRPREHAAENEECGRSVDVRRRCCVLDDHITSAAEQSAADGGGGQAMPR